MAEQGRRRPRWSHHSVPSNAQDSPHCKEGGSGPRCPCCRGGENLDSSERGAEGKTWNEVVEAEAGPARRAALRIVISVS